MLSLEHPTEGTAEDYAGDIENANTGLAYYGNLVEAMQTSCPGVKVDQFRLILFRFKVNMHRCAQRIAAVLFTRVQFLSL